MKERKGLVIRVYDGNALVLSEGEFVYVEIDGKKYKKGQEITFYTKTETKTVINWNRVISYASVPALVSLFLLIVPYFANDINLSSEKSNDVNLSPEKSNVAVMKPAVPKRVTSVLTEPKPEKKADDQQKKEEKVQKEENKPTTPKSKRKRKVTKPTNYEQKPTENRESVQEAPSRKENVPNPAPIPETAPPKEPRFKPDSRDSDSNLLTLSVGRKGVSLSVAKIGINVPLRK